MDYFLECSAKQSINIEKVFIMASKLLFKKHYTKILQIKESRRKARTSAQRGKKLKKDNHKKESVSLCFNNHLIGRKEEEQLLLIMPKFTFLNAALQSTPSFHDTI